MRVLTGILFTAMVVSTAACLDNGNTPGVTSDPEASAKAAYPDVPAAEDAMKLKERGGKLFNGLGCQSCHSTTRDRNGLMGPPLGGVSDRVLERNDHDSLKARRWLVMHVKDPLMYPSPFAEDEAYRGTHMPPNPRVTDQDLRALVEFLWTLR